MYGKNQPEIDVMFFPATFGDEVILDPPYEELPSEGTRPTSIRESIGQYNLPSDLLKRLETGFV